MGKLQEIKTSMKKYGHSVEHNPMHFVNNETKDSKNYIFKFSNNKTVLASWGYNGNYYLFPSGVLAPPKERYALLTKFLNYAFAVDKASKVVVEVDEEFRRELVSKLESSKKFRALSLNYILYWPVFEMKKFDHKLKGKQWKKLRNIHNRYRKQYRTKLVDAKSVPKEKLVKVVESWLKKRPHNDTVDQEYYFNMIKTGFRGFDVAKTLYVNGEPCTITAGWKVPHEKGAYYSSIGISNYKHKDLNIYSNLKDLMLLKQKKFKYVDFGGSDYYLLNFKSKFKPHKVYKTYVFSITKKKK